MNNISRLLGGTLLVAGTAIGAGMLALPVRTGLAGLYPSLFLFLVAWLFMTFTAFLFLEVSLWMDRETDLISMAEEILGRAGKFLSGISYLLLLYSLIVAYISGSACFVAEVVQSYFHFDLPAWFAPIPMLIVFGSFVYLGTAPVDYLNRFLMFGLTAAYSLLVVFVPLNADINLDYFVHQDWKYLLVSLSVVVTSFGFHVIIPSMSNYMDKNVCQLRRSLFIGSLIPLIVYVIWELLILGVAPLKGSAGIVSAWMNDLPATHLLKSILTNSWVFIAARFFVFFSITTSFLGVALSLSHFLADALKVKKTPSGNLLVCMLTFIPPLLFVLTWSKVFYLALEYAGIFVAVLLGILPILMVWVGRYSQNRKGYRVFGGRLFLMAAMIFFISVVCLETLNKMGYLEFITLNYLS